MSGGDSKPYSLVIDLGGTRVRAAVADSTPRLMGRVEESTSHERGAPGVVDQIVHLTREATARAGTDSSHIGRAVVSSPGPLDPTTGVVYTPPNMPGWRTVPLGSLLEERLGMPVRLLNDANAAALGEFHFGAGKGSRNLVYLTVSTGIGGGVVVEGALLEGSLGTAGEIGHMMIDRHGPACNCGGTGCLETLASGTAIARRFHESLLDDSESLVSQWVVPAEATAADVARAAAAGDPLAASVFADAAEALATGVVNCIRIFNPHVVVLGGGVTRAGPLLFDVVRRAVRRNTYGVPHDPVQAVPAMLGEDAGLMGAAAVARGRPGNDRSRGVI